MNGPRTIPLVVVGLTIDEANDDIKLVLSAKDALFNDEAIHEACQALHAALILYLEKMEDKKNGS